MSTLGIITTAAGGALVLLGFAVKIAVPMWRWFKHNGGQFSGALDNLAGRDPFTDPATGKMFERIPPIGERFSSIEEKLDALAHTNNRLDTIDARVAAHELRLDDHDTTLGLIIGEKYQKGSEAAIEAAKGVIDGEVEG